MNSKTITIPRWLFEWLLAVAKQQHTNTRYQYSQNNVDSISTAERYINIED